MNGSELNLDLKPAPKEPRIPQHPLGLKCGTCAFWNKEMVQEVLLMPNGNAMPVQAAVSMGIATVGIPKVKVSACQYFPKWENTMADAYCWQHKAADGEWNANP